MKTRILIVTTNFWPEPTGLAIYTSDLATRLNSAEYEVSVLTGLPHYPWWCVPPEFAHLVEGIGISQGVKVFRAKHLVPIKMDALKRIRFEISLWWNLRRVSKAMLGNCFDLVIAYIPTVAAGIVGKSIARNLGIPFGMIVQDVSGVGAKQSGLRGGAVISKIAHAIEGRVLRGADRLVVVSDAMRGVVVALGVPAERITQITNYSARVIVSGQKSSTRSKFGWSSDEFIVLHTGNMGSKQDLENVVRAADALPANSPIKIYLVGHGNQESKLKALCDGKSNIFVLPAVPDADYSALLSAADLLLVNERSTQMEMSLPSKLTSYLYSERAVIAAVPRGGATWKFLDGVAELVEAGDPSGLASKLEELSQNQNRLDELAKLGISFALKNLDPTVGREKYLEWVRRFFMAR